jgi:hypothetical protein
VNTYMTKDRFIEMMRTERAYWESLITKLENDQMTEPGVEGVWSVLDVVIHVTAYERWLVEWLEAASRGELPPPSDMDIPNVDERNAAILAKHRGMKVHEAWIESQDVFEKLIERIEALHEKDLTDTMRTSWFVTPYWKENKPLWQCIAGDSYEHYHQHLPAIRTWLANLWTGR